MNDGYTYYAFISYNHLDEKWAKRIQYQLQHYRLPALARKEMGQDVKIRPVFRYVTNLALGDLRENISKELEASKYLIVICSPNSAQPNIQGKHWVNDEVKRFIDLGRRNRIIPVIVGGKPNVGGEEECFPPALRGADIAGVDVTSGSKRERRNAFLKIVAKLLDLRPDMLTRYVEEEDRSIRRRFWWRLLPLFLLLALGGLFAWDSCRTVTRYYADHVDSYGLPKGIFPLGKSKIPGRHIHYRFEYRGYGWGKSIHADSSGRSFFRPLGFYRVLRRVVQSNSNGTPVEWDNAEYADRPPVQEFDYEKDWPNVGKRVRKIIYRQGTGKLERRLELDEGMDGTVNGLVKFYEVETGNAMPMFEKSGMTTLSWNEGLRNRTTISQHAIERNGEGEKIRVTFLNVYGREVADDDGIYGYDFLLGEQGRQVEQWYRGLNADGEMARVVNKIGVGGKKYMYSGSRLVRVEYVDSTGRPTRGPHGWMVYVGKFDANDREIEGHLYDEKGIISLCDNGYAEVRSEYDTFGNMTRRSYFGVDGKLTLHKDGYAGWIAEYDAHGLEMRSVWIGVDGKPTLHNDCYAETRSEYDARGNMTKSSYFGVDGKLTLSKDGIAEWIAEYDARGNETKESYFGVDGKPTLHKDGYAGWIAEYDARGNETKECYFGVDGKPTLHKDGFSERHRKYDMHGNMTSVFYFGVDGKLTQHKDGYAGWIAAYDTRGQETRSMWIGVDGKPTLDKDGYAETRSEYDAWGNMIKMSYFGVDGKPTLDKDGIAEWIAEYDERGYETRESYFGVDGKPTLHVDGYAETRSEYDARGNETKVSYFGVDGKPTLHKDGYAEWIAEYDQYGNVTNVLRYDANGNLIVPDEESAEENVGP